MRGRGVARLGAQEGQATVLMLLTTALVLLTAGFGAVSVALLVAARAALVQAGTAAALAVAQEGSVQLVLTVRYVDHLCVGSRSGRVRCTSSPGRRTVTLTGHGSGQRSWEQVVGCTAPPWLGGGTAGLFRTCAGQSLERAIWHPPSQGMALTTASQWLSAAVRQDPQLHGAAVVAVTLDPRGLVTVDVSAEVRTFWARAHAMHAHARAWAGGIS